MFYKRVIPDACGEVATIVKNYYTHEKSNPDIKIPCIKNHSIHFGRDNFTIIDGIVLYHDLYENKTY